MLVDDAVLFDKNEDDLPIFNKTGNKYNTFKEPFGCKIENYEIIEQKL